MNYEFKNKNINVKKVVKEVVEVKEVVVKEEEQGKIYKSKNPWFVWSDPKAKVFETFEDMIQAWLKSSKERCSGIKNEFTSNNELEKLAIKKSKYLKSKNKKIDIGD